MSFTPERSVGAFRRARATAKRLHPNWLQVKDMVGTWLGDESRDGRTRYEATSYTRRMKDGTFRTYAALRRFPPKVKGKAAVKAAKRARQAARGAEAGR